MIILTKYERPADSGESMNDEKDNLEVEHFYAIVYHYKSKRRECNAACLVQ